MLAHMWLPADQSGDSPGTWSVWLRWLPWFDNQNSIKAAGQLSNWPTGLRGSVFRRNIGYQLRLYIFAANYAIVSQKLQTRKYRKPLRTLLVNKFLSGPTAILRWTPFKAVESIQPGAKGSAKVSTPSSRMFALVLVIGQHDWPCLHDIRGGSWRLKVQRSLPSWPAIKPKINVNASFNI